MPFCTLSRLWTVIGSNKDLPSEEYKLLRFIYVIITGLILAVIAVIRLAYVASHDKFNEEQRYGEAVKVVNRLKKRGRISTVISGEDNLPDEGGYIMYSNHQGKYDALGIMYGHIKPLSVLMEYKKSKCILTSQFIDAIGGKRIKMDDPKQQIGVLNEIATEVKEGRRYLIFPEGGYNDNHNHLQEFRAGCFRCAIKARCPIVPICLIDSWKPFGVNSLKAVTTYVHFLKPIEYVEYCNMKAAEIGALVKSRISEKLIDILGEC